ncbi:MAG TPA: TraR/DksA C4-type zinc finger protein [Thermoleophilia bacterium]|nr:TraR/DksA C4-type zinc finger protein [Thermoleophilia bacterium]
MDRDRINESLESERERLQHEIQEFGEEFSQSMEEATEENMYDQHMADAANPMHNREVDRSLEENAKRMLGKIDRALEKLEEDSYGTCDNCGQEITEGRLEAVPYVNLCIDCERKLERG